MVDVKKNYNLNQLKLNFMTFKMIIIKKLKTYHI